MKQYGRFEAVYPDGTRRRMWHEVAHHSNYVEWGPWHDEFVPAPARKVNAPMNKLISILASRTAIAAVILACLAWWWLGLPENRLTMVLSIGAMTFSQLVLAAGRRFECAVNARLDELVFAVPEAREDLLHAEDLTEAEIEEMRK